MTFGLLLVDKPSGPTSYDMIRWVKRRLPDVKIGHCGTLDPMASGLLILLFGRATRWQSGLMGQDKTYRFTVRFGLKTDTGDVTGKVLETKPLPSLNSASLQTQLSAFVGTQMQTPPMFSAVKQGGTPLYKLARQGVTVERKSREITIRSSELLSLVPPAEAECRVRCSSGTYVRTLAEDLGEKMGTVAALSGLVRESIGSYDLSQSIPGEEIKTMSLETFSSRLQTSC